MVTTGGGYEYEEEVPVDNSVPIDSSNPTGTGWIVGMVNESALTADFYAVAHCVPGTAAAADARGVSRAQVERALVARVKAASRGR